MHLETIQEVDLSEPSGPLVFEFGDIKYEDTGSQLHVDDSGPEVDDSCYNFEDFIQHPDHDNSFQNYSNNNDDNSNSKVTSGSEKVRPEVTGSTL